METLMNRLETFLIWPDTALVSTIKLSECGLFYTGESDTVQCFRCHIRLSDWEQHHNPVERHLEASPTCPVALRVKNDQSSRVNHPSNWINQEDPVKYVDKVGNTHCNSSVSNPNEGQEAEQQQAIFTPKRNYKQADDRTASFANISSSTWPVTVADLVAAGLYYVGPGDRVQCAWCKGKLYNWEMGDTALGEHARHFPQCPFVKGVFSNQHLERETERQGQTHKDVKQNNTREEPVAAEIAEAMGFDRDVIERAMQQLSVSNTMTTAALLDILFDLEGQQNTSEGYQGACARNHDVQNPNDSKSENETETGKSHDKSFSELEELIAENLTLRESRQCVVCLVEEVKVVFLPCRHLVCCNECSMALKHCPVCRSIIMGTINAPEV